jgi:hypothetical protein
MDTHVFDPEIARVVAQLSKGKTHPLLTQFYCHYVKGGYRIVMWKAMEPYEAASLQYPA